MQPASEVQRSSIIRQLCGLLGLKPDNVGREFLLSVLHRLLQVPLVDAEFVLLQRLDGDHLWAFHAEYTEETAYFLRYGCPLQHLRQGDPDTVCEGRPHQRSDLSFVHVAAHVVDLGSAHEDALDTEFKVHHRERLDGVEVEEVEND